MSLFLLFKDEMKGFYKSKAMIVLWIGMPILSILIHYFQPDTEGFPISYLVSLLIASIGGILASVMLSTTIVSEKRRHVYDLYLIRQVKPRNILISKYLAVYFCLIIAALISLLLGLLIDYYIMDTINESILKETLESLSISFNAMSISCAAGILIATLVKSVPLAAVLSIYVGNQLSMLSITPSIFLENIDPILFTTIIGISATLGAMIISIIIFNRKIE